MFTKLSWSITSFFLGGIIGYLLFFYTPVFHVKDTSSFVTNLGFQKKEVIGFLPYWQLDKAKTDYSSYITQLAYFSLRIDTDGSIVKLANEQEEDPGWHALSSGAVDTFLNGAKKRNISRSLVVFTGDNDVIDTLMTDPIPHARTLASTVVPLMKQYGFSDLNLDIEKVSEASDEARMDFGKFVSELKKQLTVSHIATLTVDVSSGTLIRPHDLINPSSLLHVADKIMLMTYDYHTPGSFVTGPIAPLYGAGTVSENDVDTAVKKALAIFPREKIILGVPLYGYEWETIGNTPRSGVIPGTGVIASNNRVESLLASCATCSAKEDPIAKESYISYLDATTQSYHQVFFPDKNAINEKISYAKKNELGGMGLWALGYEGDAILEPLKGYK